MIRPLEPSLEKALRDFLQRHPDANYGHDPAWLDVIRDGYGKAAKAWVFADGDAVRGFAPCVHLKGVLGTSLVSLPYLDYGAPLAESPDAEGALLKQLLSEAAALGCGLETRGLSPLNGFTAPQNEKVAMILTLDGKGADPYWKSLDAKVRNQVRKAEKSQVTVKWGREELLEDFYGVFCINMRDLGSPTHARKFFSAVLKHFPGAGIGAAYRAGRPIGGLFRILWNKTLVIPWASTLKEERVHCPNNALYWESIRFAHEQGCAHVDFGRSSEGEGTYRFKKQWLAEERPLYWHQFGADGKLIHEVRHVSSGKLGWTKTVWSKLPLSLANALGPRLRGGISA
jgi:serine/alanine adding enzyme